MLAIIVKLEKKKVKLRAIFKFAFENFGCKFVTALPKSQI